MLNKYYLVSDKESSGRHRPVFACYSRPCDLAGASRGIFSHGLSSPTTFCLRLFKIVVLFCFLQLNQKFWAFFVVVAV